MSISSAPVESLRVRPPVGHGTLESPWTGWETQIENGEGRGQGGHFVFRPGFYGVSRTVRLPDETTLAADPEEAGRAWFLPADTPARLESLFLVDGAQEITISGVCLNGRSSRAHHGILVRCGAGIQVRDVRFEDFAGEPGGAILVAGESDDRPVRGLVIQSCRFLNGSVGLALERHASDVLVEGNHFEEITGPAVLIDPADRWSDYGLIFVKNRICGSTDTRKAPLLRIRPGAEGIRVAENVFLTSGGPAGPDSLPGDECIALEIRGGGAMSAKRLEVLLNVVVGSRGPGIRADECGPGFLVAGNRLTSCGGADTGAVDLVACHGVLVEDNEIEEPVGPGIRVQDCSSSRLNGNEIQGGSDSAMPRGGTAGVLVEGDGSRRLSLTDNRVSCVRAEGLRVGSSMGMRIVGNEVEDCGEGIRVAGTTNLLLVGNDCRDNGGRGIQVGPDVRRGLVALNYAILNGSVDLEVLGERIRCHSNKVDRQAGLASPGPKEG